MLGVRSRRIGGQQRGCRDVRDAAVVIERADHTGHAQAKLPAVVEFDGQRRPWSEAERLGSSGMAIRADLESLEDIEAMFDQVHERYGRLDFFVSNASASNFHHFMDIKPHHLERTFNLNVRAFVVGTQRAVRLMHGHGGGRIVVLLDGGELEVAVGEDLEVNLTGWARPVYEGRLSEDFEKELHETE